MTTRVEVEEIETTRSEKLLAGVLVVFMLIGLIWAYAHVAKELPESDYGRPTVTVAKVDREAVRQFERAQTRVSSRAARADAARSRLVDRREAYRTSLDEGAPDAELASLYRQAQAADVVAQNALRLAQQRRDTLKPAADAVRKREQALQDKAQAKFDREVDAAERTTFLRRLALVLLSLGASYVLLARLRTRRSRYLPVAMAAVASVTILALIMAVDYLAQYIDLSDLGLLVLSLAGIAMTMVAFFVLQRYLAKRIPERRVRKKECPFCGYPAHGGDHCEGCGRDVIAPCATCGAPRRVGTKHCGACGAGG